MLPPAPILLLIYKRPECTHRTLLSLAANRGAAECDLIVWADGPKNEAERPPVEAARAEARRFSAGFRSAEFHLADRNRGLAASVISAVTEVVNRFGQVIVLEDDMETSPYFLDFMREGLTRFAGKEKICQLHGYAPPMETGSWEYYLRRGGDCWGWATWKRAWDRFEPDGAALLAELRARRLTRAFDRDGAFPFTRMLAGQAAGKVDSWAIRWDAVNFLAGRFTLQSARPLVRNIGSGAGATNEQCVLETEEELCSRPVQWGTPPQEEPPEFRRAWQRHLRHIAGTPAEQMRRRFRRLWKRFFKGE